jgi:hypothetical protein
LGIKTNAIFLRSFRLQGINRTLPAGEYEIEIDPVEPADRIKPSSWTSSMLVRLNPKTSHPDLTRPLTVPLAELERAVVKDKLTGKALASFLLEELLADPMIRLVMQADGVAESDIRALYADRIGEEAGHDKPELGEAEEPRS